MASTAPPALNTGGNPIFVDENEDDELQVVDVQVHLKTLNVKGSEPEVIQYIQQRYCKVLKRHVRALQGRKNTQSEDHLTGVIVRVQETTTLVHLAKIWTDHMKKPMKRASSELAQDANTWAAFQKALPSRMLQAKFFKHFLDHAIHCDEAIKKDIVWCETAHQDIKHALFPERLGAVKTETV